LYRRAAQRTQLRCLLGEACVTEELSGPVKEATGPLAFAGEHTAGPYAALMEGAIRSGQRAARSLMRQPYA
jgi:monoamine oxidase